MKRFARALLVALALGCGACGDDVEPRRYEPVVALEENALALFGHDDTLFVALPAELVRLDPGARTPVRLTDGRYRECPWDPSEAWSGRGHDPVPRITPRGDFITFSMKGCGSWAWPLAGGDVVPLARTPYLFGPRPPLPPPRWREYDNVHVARDGDGWLAWGKVESYPGSAPGPLTMWSLGPDGAAREELFSFGGDAFGVGGERNVYEVHAEADAIYVLIAPSDRSVRRALLGRIDRASKTWHAIHTWRRNPSDPPETPRVELAAITPSHFVVIDGDQIARVAKDGGPPEPITACAGCSPIGADATHVYWFDLDGGLRVRRAAYDARGAVEELLTLAEGPSSSKVDHIVQPGLVLTRGALWLMTLEGANPTQWRPWLSRVQKPRP